MRQREEILRDLVCLNGDLSKLQLELSYYTWDIDNPILTITKTDVYYVLSKFKNENMNFDLLEDWANAIESRDDLEFENEKLKEIINEIANPTLFKQLSKDRLTEFMERLN